MANYSIKSIDQTKYGDYQAFGWVRSKQGLGADAPKKSKVPQMFVKRRNGFSYNPRLNDLEATYEKLSKKKHHKAACVIVGIIFFILFVAFLAVAGVELYFGISNGVKLLKENKATAENEETPSEAAYAAEQEAPEEGEEEEVAKTNPILDILNKIHDEYLSKVTGLVEKKEVDEAGNPVLDEETGEQVKSGIAVKLADMIPAPVKYFISGDTLVGLVALILFIVCLVIFCECSAKRGKKHRKRLAQIEAIVSEARSIVENMKRNDMSLMNKGERKMYMWETVISNGIRKANGGDDEDDDY